MIRDVIGQCYDEHGLPLDGIEAIVVHHCSLSTKAKGNPEPIADRLLDGPELARRFRNRELGTGGRTPYHVLILWDGSIEQLLPLDIRGTHCPGWNYRSLAVCTVGESEPPARSQREALAKVCTAMVLHSRGAKIHGHTALVPSPGKQCPHRGLDIQALRVDVAKRLPIDWSKIPRREVDIILSAEGYKQ